MMSAHDRRVVLLIGISRGIGRGLAAEFLRRGWSVIGTVRSPHDGLEALADGTAGSLRIEHVDVTKPEQIAALRERLAPVRLDVLFAVAGISDDDVSVTTIDDTAFNNVMVTNALAPMRIIETFQDLVTGQGTIAVMSSGQGSISRNDRGDFEVYRASKSALNQLMRSYAARHRGETRALLLIAPGWVQTGLGGPGAHLTVEESVTGVVDTIEADHAIGELRFVDYKNQTIPW
jgi:NAD(P)-dependent dehydrogenase (short-subunit alcohol dehydrogenase family)